MGAAATAKDRATAEEPAMINDRQMRQMHALFHAHGWADRADILELLTVRVGHPVEHRNELTLTEAADVIAWLEAEPRYATPANLDRLRAAFPADAIGKLPRSTCKACSDAPRGQTCARHEMVWDCRQCRGNHTEQSIHLDYVGHADVTARLLEVDPFWSWRPWTPEELNGLPPDMRGAGIWIHLTVLGISRPGFGDADGKRGGNAAKEAIGDALRNAAMRFGVALELWAKGDREWASQGGAGSHGGSQADSAAPYDGPSTAELLAELERIAVSQDTDLAGITAKWRDQHGKLAVETLPNIDPWNIAPLLDQVKAYIEKQQTENQPA